MFYQTSSAKGKISLGSFLGKEFIDGLGSSHANIKRSNNFMCTVVSIHKNGQPLWERAENLLLFVEIVRALLRVGSECSFNTSTIDVRYAITLLMKHHK